MNLIDCRWDARKEAVFPDGSRIVPGPGRAKFLQEAKGGRALVFGIRPEHAGITAFPVENGLKGKVWVVEPTGAESFVTVSLEGVKLVVRAPADFSLVPGSDVYLVPDPGRVYFFDPDTGNRIR